MKCDNCGFEHQEDFNHCPGCGAARQPVYPDFNLPAQMVLGALKDTLFLALCILVSGATILSITADNLPLLGILASVFMWLTYAKSCKNIVDTQQLRNISGTIYAQYVITNVVAIILIVVGVICLAAFDAIMESIPLLSPYLDEFDLDLSMLTQLTGNIVAIIFSLTFVVIGALILVMNIFSMRYIHRFVKSMYQSVQQSQLALKHVSGARIWLFIFGGFCGFSGLTSLISGDMLTILINFANCAIYIIAGLLIGKYFTPKEETRYN